MISRGDLALILATVIWGVSFTIVKDALEEVSSLLFLALRFSLGAIALALVLAKRLTRYRYTASHMRLCILGGVLLMAGMSLQTVGLRHTTISKSAFLTGLYIVLVPLLSSFVNRVGPRPREWVGIILATLGMALMTMNKDQWQAPSLGDALTIACAAVFAIQIMVLGAASRSGDPQLATLIQLTVCAICLFATCFWIETPRIVWSPRVISAILLTGIFATAVAISLQSWAQQSVSPTRAALLFALEPVFAFLFAWVWVGEKITSRGAAGAGLILAGILVVELKPPGLMKHQWKRDPSS